MESQGCSVNITVGCLGSIDGCHKGAMVTLMGVKAGVKMAPLVSP